MRVQVSDGVWIDLEKFDRITLNETLCGIYGWIWRIDVYEKNDILIASMSLEKGSIAKKLVDEMYNLITYEKEKKTC